MTTTDAYPSITDPGVYDLDHADYNRDPVVGGSLSSTGARKLLPPSCPALYRHWVDNPPAAKEEFEHGTAAHKLVLGVGPKLVVPDDNNGRWDTNEIKAQVAEIRAAGNIPLKRADYDRVHAMADALRAHPWASRLFAAGTGQPERTIVWRDQETGVMCRALLDWLPTQVPGTRLVFRDYKTSKTAAPDRFDRNIADYGYHVQAVFHLAGLRALDLAGDDAQALLAVQEKESPYLVTVFQLDRAAMLIGQRLMREALLTYAECVQSGRWPGYSDEVVLIGLPPWVENQYREDLM